MTYAFQPVDASGQPEGRAFTRSYRVAAIAEVPPALVDQTDEAEGTILPPGATRELLAEYMYGTVGLRLAGAPRASRRWRAGWPPWPGRSSDRRKHVRTSPRSSRLSRSTVPTSSMVRCSRPSGRSRLR